MALDSAALEQSERQHEEAQAARESHLQALEDMEEQRRSDVEELEERRQQHHEETLERDRQAGIDHRVEKHLNASSRHLIAGRTAQALEEAESALDEKPYDSDALRAAYLASKAQGANTTGYLSRLVDRHVADAQSWNDLSRRDAEWLLSETSSAYDGDRIVSRIVNSYRGTPAEMKVALATIRQSELLTGWLETRLRNCKTDCGRPRTDLLLDALSEEANAPTRIAELTGQLADWAGFVPAFAGWLVDHGYRGLAAKYVGECLRQPGQMDVASTDKVWNVISKAIESAASSNEPVEQWVELAPGYKAVFVEKLVECRYANDALSYIRKFHPEGPSLIGTLDLVPLAIEASLRCKAPFDEWVKLLRAALPKIKPDAIPTTFLQSRILSEKSRQLVTASMVDHLKKAITGPKNYQRELALEPPKSGAELLFDVKTGKLVQRPLLNLSPPIVGFVSGLVIWLLPNGQFWNAVYDGLIITLLAWGLRSTYRRDKSEVARSILGKYCYDYCTVLGRVGVDERTTSALLGQVPGVNPKGVLVGAVALCGVLAGMFYFFDLAKVSSSGARATATDSEWTRDWPATLPNLVRQTARLRLDTSGTPILNLHEKTLWWTDSNPRSIARLSQCVATKEKVTCSASVSIAGTQFPPAPGRLELDLRRGSGSFLLSPPGESAVPVALYGTPSSLNDALTWISADTAPSADTSPTVKPAPENSTVATRAVETKAISQVAPLKPRAFAQGMPPVGVWEGMVKTRSRSFLVANRNFAQSDSQTVVMEVHAAQVGMSAGQSRYPSLGCSMPITLQRVDNGTFVYSESVDRESGRCVYAGLISLAADPNGGVDWMLTDPANPKRVLATATLLAATQPRLSGSVIGASGDRTQANTPTFSATPAVEAAQRIAPSTAPTVPNVQDASSGCSVWKPEISPNESVTWSGRCVNGLADGKGMAQWAANGNATLTYEGTFVAGVLQGRGRMTAAGGDRYDGDYRDGKRDGPGAYTTATGDRYDGEFKDNKRNGRGILTRADGSRFEGMFRDGKIVDGASSRTP